MGKLIDYEKCLSIADNNVILMTTRKQSKISQKHLPQVTTIAIPKTKEKADVIDLCYKLITGIQYYYNLNSIFQI